MRAWGRRLEALGGIFLMIAPALAWARFPLLGHTLWLPGWFYHGGVLLGLGLLALVLCVGRARVPGLQVLLAMTALGVVLVDRHEVMTRTEYTLDRMQMTVAQNTGGLDTLGIHLPRLAPTSWAPEEFVGIGVLIGGAAGGVLLLGAGLETLSYRPQRTVVSVLLGLPACSTCHKRVSLDMGFCPYCGQNLLAGYTCARCGEWCPGRWQFCARCGVPTAPPVSGSASGGPEAPAEH